jgi:hypothetical protein
MAEKLYIQFTAEIEGDLTIPVDDDDPTGDATLAAEAVENEYPGAKQVNIYNISRIKTS